MFCNEYNLTFIYIKILFNDKTIFKLTFASDYSYKYDICQLKIHTMISTVLSHVRYEIIITQNDLRGQRRDNHLPFLQM